MTTDAILERLRDDHAFWCKQEGEADDNQYYRFYCKSRREYITDILSWLPKELDRLVIAVRAEGEEEPEPDCPNCDEDEGHGGECVLRVHVSSYDVAFDLAMDETYPRSRVA